METDELDHGLFALKGWVLACLFLFPLPDWSEGQVMPGQVVISEILASNEGGLSDEDGDFEDWIELENRSAFDASLQDLYLTDDSDNLFKWAFPSIILPAGERLVVFASGKDRAGTAENPHTNFKLNRMGEFLALLNSAGEVIDALSPNFPRQQTGFSYGIDPVFGEFRYFQSPTPGSANSSSNFLGFLDEVVIEPVGGFYDGQTEVFISHADPMTTIRYTIDASTPTETSLLFQDPIAVTETTVVRGRAFRSNYVSSQIRTETYLMNQSDGVKSLPAFSVVTATANLVDPTAGVFTNPLGRGRAWERPGNIELLFPAGSGGFNANCGIRLHASPFSRMGTGFVGGKNSLRIYFREAYGPSEIRFPLIPLSAVPRYKRLVLRAGKNDARNPFIRDEMIRRTFHAMGQVSSLGTFAHLFLNGQNKAYYNPVERLDDDFMRDKHGRNNDWDVIRQGSEAADGDNLEWLEVLDFARNNDLTDPANYAIMDASFDLVNLIDYLLVNIYTAMGDWPGNNWTAARERTPGAPFRFYVWDAEGGLQEQGTNTFTERLNSPHSSEIPTLYQAVRNNPDFQSKWAQRVRDHFYGWGALTDSSLRSRWFEMRDEVSGITALRQLFSSMPNQWVKVRRMTVLAHLFSEDLNLIQPLDSLAPQPGESLAINEVMARNRTTIADENGEFEDWVEIYNFSSTPVDLGGMFLTDDLSLSTQWEFPANTIIDPFQFLIVWTDGDVSQGPLHASFQLNGNGEEIALFDSLAEGNGLLDTVSFGSQEEDRSVGRRPDGIGKVAALPFPSPGNPNGAESPGPGFGEVWAISRLPVGPGAADVAIGDVDNDGNADLISTNVNFGSVAVYHGAGPHTRTFRGPFFYPAALGSKGVALADLNKDSFLDIITANDGLVDYSVSILPNSGNGVFGNPLMVPLYSMVAGREGLHPHRVESGDIDGDGWNDVVVSNIAPFNSPHLLSVLFNDRAGGLVSASELMMTHSAEISTGRNFILSDLEGDGDLDLVSLTDDRALSVSFNQGDGSLGPASDTAEAPSRSFSIAAADFDGDGDLDLATFTNIGLIYVFLNQGGGVFDAPSVTIIPGPRKPEALTAGDFDRDGDWDLAIAMSTVRTGDGPGISVFVNDGAGSFELGDDRYQVNAPDEHAIIPRDIETGDLDGDGLDDIVITDGAGGNLVVYFNQININASVDNWNRY